MRISSRSPFYYHRLKRHRESRASLNACVEREHPLPAAAEVQAEPELSEIINAEIVHAEINLKNCISVTQDCDKDQENSNLCNSTKLTYMCTPEFIVQSYSKLLTYMVFKVRVGPSISILKGPSLCPSVVKEKTVFHSPNEAIQRKQKLLATISRPQNSF